VTDILTTLCDCECENGCYFCQNCDHLGDILPVTTTLYTFLLWGSGTQRERGTWVV